VRRKKTRVKSIPIFFLIMVFVFFYFFYFYEQENYTIISKENVSIYEKPIGLIKAEAYRVKYEHMKYLSPCAEKVYYIQVLEFNDSLSSIKFIIDLQSNFENRSEMKIDGLEGILLYFPGNEEVKGGYSLIIQKDNFIIIVNSRDKDLSDVAKWFVENYNR